MGEREMSKETLSAMKIETGGAMRVGTLNKRASWLSGAFATLLVLLVAVIWTPSAGAEFGIVPESFTGRALDQNGNDYTQAGGHPVKAVAEFKLNSKISGSFGGPEPDDNLKNAVVDVPPGFIGNPSATPRCSEDDFHDINLAESADLIPGCSPASQVGLIVLNGAGAAGDGMIPIYNLEPPANSPAAFGFVDFKRFIRVLATARTDGDFGIRTIVKDIVEANAVTYSYVELWGVPGDPSHDAVRGVACSGAYGGNFFCNNAAGTAFTICSGVNTTVPAVLEELLDPTEI